MTGQLDKLTYPSSRQVQHGYDAADRLTSVSSGLVSVGIPKYHPQGTPEEVLYGNGVKEVWTLTKRLQVGSIAVTKGGASLLTLGYGYGTGVENNGNVRTQSIQAGGHTFAQSYNYDALNRLETASETTTVPSSSNWSIGFQYDQYGNMAANGWTISVPAAMATSLAQYDPATNRRSRTAGGATISPNPYDKGGNLTSDPALGTMQYDQAGRLRQTQVLGKTITYDYDAEGRRVRRDYPGLGTTYYVYDGAGQLAAEYGASEPMSCTRCYLTADTLGSTRLLTDELGGVKQRTDYLPFGDVITASPTQGGGRQVITDGAAQTTFALAGGPTQKFTGKERDAETGLDYMDFRYYGGAQGRFMSPDPFMASANVADPQSWNRYVYARNNPLRYNDPLGLYPSPAYNCSDTQSSCLNDEQRRVLENSSVKVGKETLSGEKLWSYLGGRENGEALQNAFVNITDKLGSITLKGGGTALSQVSGLTEVKADRLYANVSQGLAGALAGSSAFASVSAGDHAPYNAASYKNVADVRGNIQFSFNESRRGADIDIDLGNMSSRNPMGPLIHIGEVLQNKITNTTTSQDAVRKILMANPSVMITPSPDPKWNRK